MASPIHVHIPPALASLAALGGLLERLERSPRGASAAQYRDVARRVTDLLARAQPGADLDTLLAGLPATAELYENLHYGQAGLCRSPLEAAARAEIVARESLRRTARTD